MHLRSRGVWLPVLHPWGAIRAGRYLPCMTSRYLISLDVAVAEHPAFTSLFWQIWISTFCFACVCVGEEDVSNDLRRAVSTYLIPTRRRARLGCT
eukprot:6127248-Pyramimonas_sp.AAC.1